MLTENNLRGIIRNLIKEFWKPSRNMQTLGDPYGSDFFQSQSRELYGYDVGDKELLVNLQYYIDLIAEENSSGAQKIEDLAKQVYDDDKLQNLEKDTGAETLTKEAITLLEYLKYFLSDSEYDAGRIKKDIAYFKSNLTDENVKKIKAYLKQDNNLLDPLKKIKDSVININKRSEIDIIKKHLSNTASNLYKIFYLIGKITQ